MSAEQDKEQHPKKPRRGGRKPVAADLKQSHLVTVRLTPGEYQRLEQQAQRHRLFLGEVLRRGWARHGVAQFLPVARTPQQVREIAVLAGMAAALHQLKARPGWDEHLNKGLLVVLQRMNALLKSIHSEGNDQQAPGQ